MEDGLLKEFSDRADKAEKRLDYIEKKISSSESVAVAKAPVSVIVCFCNCVGKKKPCN